MSEFNYLKSHEDKIAEIEKSLNANPTDNTSKKNIDELKNKLFGHPLKFAFFCKGQAENLNRRINIIEQEYNLRIWKNTLAWCDVPSNRDEVPAKLNSTERKERCKKRIDHLTVEQTKLTGLTTRVESGRSVINCFTDKIAQEQKLLSDISKEGGFDDAIYQLSQTKSEDKCRYIESLLDKYESTHAHRKKDFEDLRRNLKVLEQEYHDRLKEDLKKFKDIANSKDYTHRIELARQRIQRIEREKIHLSSRSLWHVENAKLINDEKQNIKNWEHDREFHTAFNAVMSSDDKGKIRRILDFMQKYPKDSYPRCSADWDNANQKLKKLIEAVNNSLWDILNKNKIDVPNITSAEKEKRLKNSIAAYENAKQENPTEKEVYSKEIGNLQITLQAVMKDKNFESKYNEIMESADEGKLKRIHAFVTGGEFNPANYPHMSAAYKKLESETRRLLGELKVRQKNVTTQYADDTNKKRAVRLSQAELLLAEYQKIHEEYLPTSGEYNDLTRIINILNDKIAEHKKYNELINEFNKIKMLSDSFLIINEIATFENNFMAENYPDADGKEIFQQLNGLKEMHAARIKSDYEKAENDIKKPGGPEFNQLAIYYQKLEQNSKSFMQRLSDGLPFKKQLEQNQKLYSDNIKKYQIFAKIVAEVNPLIANDGQANIEEAKTRLNAIKSFYSNDLFKKELESEPELGEFLSSLKTMQLGVENYVGSFLAAELEKLSKELAPEASLQDQIRNWEKQLDLIDGYCAIMIQSVDNALFRNFDIRRKELSDRLGQKKLRERYNNDCQKMLRILEATSDFSEKISALNNVITTYNKYPEFADDLKGYEIKRDNFVQERAFYNFEKTCADLISSKPTNTAQTFELISYRDNIYRKLNDLKEFESISVVMQQHDDLKNRLNVELDYIKKAIGDGSWSDIQKKETAYKKHPNEDTYKSLKNAIDNFDRKEYASYEDKVDEINANFQDDWRMRKSIEDSWSNLVNNPSNKNWDKFSEKIQQFGNLITNRQTYSSSTDLFSYVNYYNKLSNSQEIQVEFISISGLEKLREVWGKSRIEFKLKNENTTLFDIKFEGYTWERGQRYDENKGEIKFSTPMTIKSKLTYVIYSIGNWTGKSYDTIHVDAIEILVPLIAGKNKIISKDYFGKHVTVKLEFSM